MPTELNNETGEAIRELAHEYGTVSQRPRRCGWFDAVAARFSIRINGCTSIAVTRLDVLDNMPQIKICTSYKLDGKIIDYFPANILELERCQPVYEELPGWESKINDIRDFDRLPVNAQKYLLRLEELLSCPVSLISVGKHREQTVVRQSIF